MSQPVRNADELPAVGTPVERPVGRPAPERMVCDDCGHTGDDGGSTTESYCGACGATVPYPDEDTCAECGTTNCMLIACPACGGHYRPESDLVDDSMTPNVGAKPRCTAEPKRADL